MNRRRKILLLEFWFFIWLPILSGILNVTLGPAGDLLFLFLFTLWCWQLFAYCHYRYCRQEEFLYVLQTAADTQAPIESVLRAYLKDRPKGDAYRVWVAILLTFVFPGYYWIHKQRSFDARLHRLSAMLQGGASLNQALRLVPGVVSREVALAVAVGQFSGKLPQALRRLPDRRLTLQLLELGPRLAYPYIIFSVMLANLSFMMIFIVPKYEKIFLEFKMKLPYVSELLIASSRWFVKYWYVNAFVWLFLLALANLLLFSSRVRWYCPGVGWLYRLYARGQFLHVLGLMLETGKPLPEILAAVTASGLLPNAVAGRAWRLARDLDQGQPLAESLTRNGLAGESMQGFIVTAEKAQNLPWALAALGESLTRRSAQFSYRLAAVLFPLSIFACALLVAFVCVAMFTPLVSLIEGIHG